MSDGWAYARLIAMRVEVEMPQEANQAAGRTLPAWLDGRTIAIIGSVLTVGICLGAMVHWSTEALRAEIHGLHTRGYAHRTHHQA